MGIPDETFLLREGQSQKCLKFNGQAPVQTVAEWQSSLPVTSSMTGRGGTALTSYPTAPVAVESVRGTRTSASSLCLTAISTLTSAMLQGGNQTCSGHLRKTECCSKEVAPWAEAHAVP